MYVYIYYIYLYLNVLIYAIYKYTHICTNKFMYNKNKEK